MNVDQMGQAVADTQTNTEIVPQPNTVVDPQITKHAQQTQAATAQGTQRDKEAKAAATSFATKACEPSQS